MRVYPTRKFCSQVTLLTLFITTSTYSLAEAPDAEKLHYINQDLSRCLVLLDGNFQNDAQTKTGSEKIYRALFANTQKIIELELENGTENIVWFQKILGKGALTGMSMATYLEPNYDLREERSELNKLNDHSFKETNRTLWKKYGCVSIFNNL